MPAALPHEACPSEEWHQRRGASVCMPAGCALHCMNQRQANGGEQISRVVLPCRCAGAVDMLSCNCPSLTHSVLKYVCVSEEHLHMQIHVGPALYMSEDRKLGWGIMICTRATPKCSGGMAGTKVFTATATGGCICRTHSDSGCGRHSSGRMLQTEGTALRFTAFPVTYNRDVITTFN